MLTRTCALRAVSALIRGQAVGVVARRRYRRAFHRTYGVTAYFALKCVAVAHRRKPVAERRQHIRGSFPSGPRRSTPIIHIRRDQPAFATPTSECARELALVAGHLSVAVRADDVTNGISMRVGERTKAQRTAALSARHTLQRGVTTRRCAPRLQHEAIVGEQWHQSPNIARVPSALTIAPHTIERRRQPHRRQRVHAKRAIRSHRLRVLRVCT